MLLALAEQPEHRYVVKCLNSNCSYVFVSTTGGSLSVCPKYKNRGCGSVRQGDVRHWPLKEAKRIAAILRNERKDNDG